jgi:hypothetical protein
MNGRGQSGQRRRKGAVTVLTAALCWMSGCARSLPDFPPLDLSRFHPEIRKAIEQQANQAKANPRYADQTLRLGMVLHAHDQFQAASQCQVLGESPENATRCVFSGLLLGCAKRCPVIRSDRST